MQQSHLTWLVGLHQIAQDAKSMFPEQQANDQVTELPRLDYFPMDVVYRIHVKLLDRSCPARAFLHVTPLIIWLLRIEDMAGCALT